ncbi:hypothetical protein ACFLYP_03505 [Chloroflexota bacterium]
MKIKNPAVLEHCREKGSLEQVPEAILLNYLYCSITNKRIALTIRGNCA